MDISAYQETEKKYVTSILFFLLAEKNSLIYQLALSQYKNLIEWLKYDCPCHIINFRCLLLKSYFRMFYFGLETYLNKLVKLSSYLIFSKIVLNKTAECLIFFKNFNMFSNRSEPNAASKSYFLRGIIYFTTVQQFVVEQ